MNPQDLSDLDWRAFLYVAGELDDAQRDAFEEELAVDQSAREAVARAVELSQMMSAAHELERIVQRSSPLGVPSARRGHSAWLRPVAYMSAGAAACLALVALGSFWSELSWPGTVTADQNTLALARAWSSAREEQADHEKGLDNELARLEAQEAELAIGNMRLDDEALELDGLPAPSWMLSALATEGEPADEGTN
jgi:hypothetical protein